MNVYDVALIPLIVGIVEIFKQMGMPARFGALVSLLLGIIAGIFYIDPSDILKGILVGASIGLAASGLYSGTKNAIEDIRKK